MHCTHHRDLINLAAPGQASLSSAWADTSPGCIRPCAPPPHIILALPAIAKDSTERSKVASSQTRNIPRDEDEEDKDDQSEESGESVDGG
jgi:hypothetical protein